jgi:hypothetical protein
VSGLGYGLRFIRHSFMIKQRENFGAKSAILILGLWRMGEQGDTDCGGWVSKGTLIVEERVEQEKTDC